MPIKVSELKNRLKNRQEKKVKKVTPLITRMIDFLNRHKGMAYTSREIAKYLRVETSAISKRIGFLVKKNKVEYTKPYYYVLKNAVKKKPNKKR